MTSEQVHATCVSVDGLGVLLRGPSGIGKSDLCLRLIDQGGILVADDRVNLISNGDHISASSPPEIAGLIEVRGVGIFKLISYDEITVQLIVDLVNAGDVPRLPETATVKFLGIEMRHLKLNAFEQSTPAKIRLALGAPRDAMVEPSWPK